MMFTVLSALLLFAGCGQSSDEGTDFPLTTVSDEARQFFIQGRDAMEMGRRDDARLNFDKAIEVDPAFAIAYLYRARLSNSAQEWKKYTDLALANRTVASEAEQLLIDMVPLYIQDDREAVLAQAKKIAEMYPDGPRARLELAYAYGGMDMVEERRSELKAIISAHPAFSPAYSELASSFIFNEPMDYRQAEEYANSFVELEAEEADAHILLGDVYRAQVQLEKARDAYAKAVEVDPSHPVGYSKKGHANTFLGSYDEARADYTNAIDHSDGAMKVGSANFGVYTYIYAGNLSAALDANSALLRGIPGMISDASQQRQAQMMCSEDRCRIAAAAGLFEEARAAFTEHAVLKRTIATELGIPEFVSSTEAELAELEGWIAAMAGDYASALAGADAVAEHLAASKNPRKLEGAYLLKGYIALQQGDANVALENFMQADTELVTVKYFMAQAKEILGGDDEAKKLYREVADWNFNSIDYALIRNKAIAKI
jgi:tetratricopeptide (TPR) repeat protein